MFVWSCIVYFLCLVVISAYMAEMCSVYPFVGGVYHWAAAYANPKYARQCSLVCGTLYFIGSIAFDISIALTTSQMFPVLIGLMLNSTITATVYT